VILAEVERETSSLLLVVVTLESFAKCKLSMTKLARRKEGGSRDTTFAVNGNESRSIDTAQEVGDRV
jgi:hypothetical protein